MVVNYDVPEDAENYVHRIGRTARVGKTGKALTMACERFVFGLEAIEKYIGMKIPVETLEEGLLVEDKSAGMKIHSEHWGRGDRRDRGERREGRGRPGERRHSRPERPRFPRENPAQPVGTDAPSPQTRPQKRPDRFKDEQRRDGRPERERIEGRPERRGPRKGVKLTQEERLTLYREKYGENFQKPDEKRRKGKRPEAVKLPEKKTEPKIAEKPSLFKKILGFFTGKSS